MKMIFLIIITQLVFGLGVKAQTTRELRDSLTMIEGLIMEHPKAYKLYLRKAALSIDLGQWEKALDAYNDALDIVPSNLTALYYRGYVYHHLHRYAFARKDYEAVLRITPQDLHAWMGLTLANLEDGRETRAFDEANHLVELFPDTAQVYALRSEVEDRLKMPDAAIDDIQKAIEIEKVTAEQKFPFADDDDIVTYELSLFNLYMEKKDTKSAKQCLAYLEKNGTNKGVLVESYMALKKRKYYASARKYTYNIYKKGKKAWSFSSY